MSIKVFRFGCLAPVIGEQHVRSQLRAAHDYQNELIAIERGRRDAIRAVDDADENVIEAKCVLRAATKSTRKAALVNLRTARKEARARAKEELDRIESLAKQIAKDARAITPCFWGTYLDVEARIQQSRAANLYADDGLEPASPKFRAWRGDRYSEGQVGVQLQGGLSTSNALSGSDRRVRMILEPDRLGREGYPRYGKVHLRVGSDGRDPVWAAWPVKLHRAMPDQATWKWVRVSVRMRGLREEWSCEITLDDPAPSTRTLDSELSGAIAIEWDWTLLDGDRMRVASWADSRGDRGEVILSAEIVKGIRKAEGIGAIRDLLANELRPKLDRALKKSKDYNRLPEWLRKAAERVEYSKSLPWLHAIHRRWSEERIDSARDAFLLLEAWRFRDAHLWDYQAGARKNALGWRKDTYRILAAKWAREYRTALISDQDLSREAKWGEEGSARQLSACYELRSAIQQAFAEDAVSSRWRDKPSEGEERSWCERARDAWNAVGARDGVMFAKLKEKTGNAWAARKKKIADTGASVGIAREPADKISTSLGT